MSARSNAPGVLDRHAAHGRPAVGDFGTVVGTGSPTRRRSLTPAVVGVVLALSASGAMAFADPVAIGYERLRGQVLTERAEVHCLALNIYHEARGEPLEGKLAVASVTLNRVRSERYPDRVCDVVWQRGQFSWTHDGRSDVPRDRRSWEAALRMARTVYRTAQFSTVGRATHFHASSVRPAWASAKRLVRRVGRHLFYESSEG
ncbi:MAG: cell wall hydrolase [Ectothiorhodospiraceae bacterium]|nr:cell wall hydrolase [Ectothiorhodospiraceae bacterium]